MTRAAIEASPDGTISVLREQVPIFMPDADKQAQDLFFELLVPQPGGYFVDPIVMAPQYMPDAEGSPLLPAEYIRDT